MFRIGGAYPFGIVLK